MKANKTKNYDQFKIKKGSKIVNLELAAAMSKQEAQQPVFVNSDYVVQEGFERVVACQKQGIKVHYHMKAILNDEELNIALNNFAPGTQPFEKERKAIVDLNLIAKRFGYGRLKELTDGIIQFKKDPVHLKRRVEERKILLSPPGRLKKDLNIVNHNLSTRALNSLAKLFIDTKHSLHSKLSVLENYSLLEIGKIRGCGPNTALEIRDLCIECKVNLKA